MQLKPAATHSVKRTNISTQLTLKLRQEIFTGQYKPGGKLPPEREIAERCGISRITVRQALQELAREGWIAIVQGSGATVLNFRRTVGLDVLPSLLTDSPQAVVTPETFQTMHEFANWLYLQICLSAAPKTNPGDERTLMQIVSRYEEEIGVEEYVDIEEAFYNELLRIGENLVLQMFFNTYMKTVRGLVEAGALSHPPLPKDLRVGLHQNLAAALCGKKADRIASIFDHYKPAIQAELGRCLNALGIDIAP